MVGVEHYATVLECWRAGQVSDAELVEQMQADGLFRAWVLEHLREAAE